MREYFRISRTFLFTLLAIFFVSTLLALTTPPLTLLHDIAIDIASMSIMASPVISIATLITGTLAMRQKMDDSNRMKRKTSEFRSLGFEPDAERIEYILSQLEPEDRAYLEHYYAMQQISSARLQDHVYEESYITQRIAS